MVKSKENENRLFRFMSLFGINRFKVFSSDAKIIRAQVGWPSDDIQDHDGTEETQDILWHVQDSNFMDDALVLGKFIFDNKLISNDKILVDYEVLQDRINWDSKKFDVALQTLLSIKVSMVDDNKETDSFFIHF